MLLYDKTPVLTENNVRISDELNIIKSDFGDGYGATAPAGLNHIRLKATVVWKNLPKDKNDEVMELFRERGGYKNFRWSPPNTTESYLWKCEKYVSEPLAPDYYTISAEFYQTFDLGEDY